MLGDGFFVAERLETSIVLAQQPSLQQVLSQGKPPQNQLFLVWSLFLINVYCTTFVIELCCGNSPSQKIS